MIRYRTIFAAILILVSGCNSRQAEPPKMQKLPTLSIVGSENVAAVMQLIDELCIKRSANSLLMQQGLAASGWQWQQVQHSDPKNPLSLDLWKAPAVQLIRGNLAGEDITNCTISVEGVAAPDPSSIAQELSKLTKTTDQMAQEWWQSNASTQTHIELTDSAFDQKAGISVIVENYKLPWWQSLLGI